MEHIPQWCRISGCPAEADYWIVTNPSQAEAAPDFPEGDTFYLCVDHMSELSHEETNCYKHLNFTTGRIADFEFGKYSCHNECEVCED